MPKSTLTRSCARDLIARRELSIAKHHQAKHGTRMSPDFAEGLAIYATLHGLKSLNGVHLIVWSTPIEELRRQVDELPEEISQ